MWSFCSTRLQRLARAYNTVAPASGKVLTGGVDAYALERPKRIFGRRVILKKVAV